MSRSRVWDGDRSIMTTTAGKVCIFIGLIVLFTGLFVTMSTLVGLFMIFAGIMVMIQGANMKPIVVSTKPTKTVVVEETKTYTNLGQNKDTKGPLANYKVKGAV